MNNIKVQIFREKLYDGWNKNSNPIGNILKPIKNLRKECGETVG